VARDWAPSEFCSSEVFDGKDIVQQEIAIRDFPMGSTPSKQQGHVARDPRKSEFGKSGIGVSGISRT
jgi:hypothetical protein